MTSYAKRVRAVYPDAVVRREGALWFVLTHVDGRVLATADLRKWAWGRAANALEDPIEGEARVVGNAVEVTLPADHPLVVGLDVSSSADISAEVTFETLGDRIRIVSIDRIERVRQPQTPNPAFDAFVARLSKGDK